MQTIYINIYIYTKTKLPIRIHSAAIYKQTYDLQIVVMQYTFISFNIKYSIKVMLYSYLILKKMNDRITDSYYINKYT